MGMYCCCGWKMSGSMYIDIPNDTHTYYEPDPDGCTCDWDGWISIHDWPPERKNKEQALGLPSKEGEYLIRCANGCGDRDEYIQTFSVKTRKVRCGYTGKELQVHWSGDDESQPYAWKESKENEK
jgi:hypothetical protein